MSNAEAPIESVLHRVLGGDLDAYAEVVRRHQARVWKVAAAMLHDVETTEDIVQQAFVNAYFHLDRFELGRDFGRWIESIARNLVRQELRRRSREAHRLRRYWERLLADWGHDESAAARQEDLNRALETCRGRLSAEAASVLDLRYGKCLGFEEIAAAIGRTVQATRQFLSRIRLQLRECVERRLGVHR